jgi:hypothetical protein
MAQALHKFVKTFAPFFTGDIFRKPPANQDIKRLMLARGLTSRFNQKFFVNGYD